jgi:putative transport protein
MAWIATALPQWLVLLFQDNHSAAHTALLIALVAACGLAIGSIQFRGLGLGVAGVLFSGLLVGHLYGRQDVPALNEPVMEFVREFGLILFVYTIGVQVGPGFCASLRRNGLPLNLMAATIVVLGALIVIGIHVLGDVPVPAAVGLFSGATTNTPSLGAAREALKGLNAPDESITQPGIAYAMAYPFGIIGIIVSMLLMRLFFRVNPHAEAREFAHRQEEQTPRLSTMNIEIKNPNFDRQPLGRIPTLDDGGVVISRIKTGGSVLIPRDDTEVRTGTILHAVGEPDRLEELRLIVGDQSEVDLKTLPSPITTRRVLVTRRQVLGKTPRELKLAERLGVTITRINRAEIELSAHSSVHLQFGDTVVIVGGEEAIAKASAELGDSIQRLNHPQIIPLFVGIALGVVLGSLAIPLPGMPAPVKLGLAGGPLLVAIVLSRLGNIGPVVWYMPLSANFMLRELGIVLFLSCVGLNAGHRFVDTLMGPGLVWMGYGAIITVVPLLLVGVVARVFMKTNYMTLCGLLAGSMTDPPALAFANSIATSTAPSISYATVYPLVMLLRVFVAQLLVLILMR